MIASYLTRHKRKAKLPNLKNSSEHSKVTQTFAEAAVFYWLSKSGFKCSKMYLAAITIIAKRASTKERFGILVKIRSENIAADSELVSIREKELKRIKRVCRAIKCIPCIAVIIEQKDEIWIFMSSLRHLLEIQPSGTATVDWKMSEVDIMRYLSDNEIMAVELNHKEWTCW
jgi:hypothetical protein